MSGTEHVVEGVNDIEDGCLESTLDEASGKVYYFNTKTKKTQWEKPKKYKYKNRSKAQESSEKKKLNGPTTNPTPSRIARLYSLKQKSKSKSIGEKGGKQIHQVESTENKTENKTKQLVPKITESKTKTETSGISNSLTEN